MSVIASELHLLSQSKIVSKVLKVSKGLGAEPDRRVSIAVTFRTDGNGKVHGAYDKAGLEAMNKVDWDPKRKGGAFSKITVDTVSLPRGASGSATPDRVASFADLDGVDLVYIPGAPAAIASQVATTGGSDEERNFNRKELPTGQRPPKKQKDARRAFDRMMREAPEALSRGPYELQIIKIARDRGIPVLAVCAGSWRLLESYGGAVRTLPIHQRGLHKAENQGDTWNLTHGVKIGQTPGSMLASTGPSGGAMPGINSTHWAVACERYNMKKGGRVLAPRDPAAADPDLMLDITAFADDPVAATVEAFESKYGAPTMGIQWHPETYLPDMPGCGAAPEEGKAQATALFKFLIQAAFAAKTRGVGVAQQLAHECRALEFLKQAAKLMSKGQNKVAESHVQMAFNTLPVAKWSGNMDDVFNCIVLLEDSLAEVKAGKPIAAANLYRDAARRLGVMGISI